MEAAAHRLWLHAGRCLRRGHRRRARVYRALVPVLARDLRFDLTTAYLTLLAAGSLVCLTTAALWALLSGLGFRLP